MVPKLFSVAFLNLKFDLNSRSRFESRSVDMYKRAIKKQQELSITLKID